jgi:hypothetical protein
MYYQELRLLDDMLETKCQQAAALYAFHPQPFDNKRGRYEIVRIERQEVSSDAAAAAAAAVPQPAELARQLRQALATAAPESAALTQVAERDAAGAARAVPAASSAAAAAAPTDTQTAAAAAVAASQDQAIVLDGYSRVLQVLQDFDSQTLAHLKKSKHFDAERCEQLCDMLRAACSDAAGSVEQQQQQQQSNMLPVLFLQSDGKVRVAVRWRWGCALMHNVLHLLLFGGSRCRSTCHRSILAGSSRFHWQATHAACQPIL